GIVVLARHACGVEIIAERRPHASDLVRSELFALSAPTNDDPAICEPVDDRAADAGADGRVIDRFFAVRTVILDIVTQAADGFDQVLLQREPRVIRTDRDAHQGIITVPRCESACWNSKYSASQTRPVRLKPDATSGGSRTLQCGCRRCPQSP